MQAEQKNWALRESGASIAAVSHEATHAASGAENLLADKDSTLWIAGDPPQFVTLELASLHPPICFAGWSVCHDYSTNPKLVEVSSGITRDTLSSVMLCKGLPGTGSQLWKLPQPIPSTHRFVCFSILKTFDEGPTYMNTVILLSSPPGLQYSHFREPKLGTLDKTISRNSSPPPTNTMAHYPVHQSSISSNPANGSMDRTMASSFSSLSGTGCPPLTSSEGVAGLPSGDSPPWAARTTGGSADPTKVVDYDARLMVPPLVFPHSSASEERAARSHSEGGAAEESFPTGTALPSSSVSFSSSALLSNAPHAVDSADPASASPQEKELWSGNTEVVTLTQKNTRKVGEERDLTATPVASTDFSALASPSSPPRSIKSQLSYLINDVSRLRQLQGISPRVDPIIPFLPAPLPLEKEMPYTLAMPTTSNLTREEDEENEEEGEEYEEEEDEEEEEEEEEKKEKGKAHKVEEEEEDDRMEPSDDKKTTRYSRLPHRHHHPSHPSRHPSSDSFYKKDKKSGREKMRRSHLQRHASSHHRKHPKEDDSSSHASSSSSGSRFSTSLHSSSSSDGSAARHHTRGSRHSHPARGSRHWHHDAPPHHRHSSSSHNKKKKNRDASSGHRYYYYDPRDRNGHIPYSVPPSATRDPFFRSSAGVSGREVPMGWQEEDRVPAMQWGSYPPSLSPPFALVSLPDGRKGSALPGASSPPLPPPERTTAAVDGTTPYRSPSAVQAKEGPSQAPSTAPHASLSPPQSVLGRQLEDNARLAAVESSLAVLKECVRMHHEDTAMLKRWALQAQLAHSATRHPDRSTPRGVPREADEDDAKGKKAAAAASKGEERHRGVSPSHDVALKMITTVMEAHVKREALLVGRVDHLEGTVSDLAAQLQACQSQLAALERTCAQRHEHAKKNTLQLHQQCNERWNVWEKNVAAPRALSQADPPIRHGKERQDACAVLRQTEDFERSAEERRPDGGRRRKISNESRRTPSSPSSMAWVNRVPEEMMRAYVMKLVEASVSRQQHTWEKQMLHSLDHYLMDVTNHVIKVVRKHVRVMVKEEQQQQHEGRVGGGESMAKGGPFPSLPPTASSAPSPPSAVVLVLQQEGKRERGKQRSLHETERKEMHAKRRVVEKRRKKKHPLRHTREKDSCSESSHLHEDSHEKEKKLDGRSSTRGVSGGAPWVAQENEGEQKRSAYGTPPPHSLSYNGSPAPFSNHTPRQSPLPADGHQFAYPPHPAYPTAPSSASDLHGMPPTHPFYFPPPYWPAPRLESTAPRGTPPAFACADGTGVKSPSSTPQSGSTQTNAFSVPATSNTDPSPKRGEGEGLPFPTPLTPPSSTSGVSIENLLRFYYLHHPPPDRSAPHRVNGYPAEEAPLATIGEETSTESE